MGLSARRRNQKLGQASNVMIIPAGIKVGEESSIAANRLILADPRGEIPPGELLEFFEGEVEAKFWEWYTKRKERGTNVG